MGSSRSVLVVDDSAAVRREVRQALETAGLDVVEAENGAQGLAAVRSRSFDLMLVDVNMPVMDGLEMIAKVRAIPACRATPILVLTTESGVRAARRGKAAGATAWIVKPIDCNALVKGVKDILRAPG